MKKAVALKYPENSPAPFITAKGKGELAEKILAEAKKNDIEIREDLELVEMLSAQEIGNYVQEETWEALAVIFSFILEKK